MIEVEPGETITVKQTVQIPVKYETTLEQLIPIKVHNKTKTCRVVVSVYNGEYHVQIVNPDDERFDVTR